MNECVIWENWKVSPIFFCTVHTDDLRKSIFHEMAQQNPEIFWCTDDQTLERLF